MPRNTEKRELGIWMNGEKVGSWFVESSGIHVLRYDPEWIENPKSRPISLSLPLNAIEHRGQVVAHFFDNLLPDSTEIRQRIKSRYGAASLSSFDLLKEIGRDCVGAIQLLPIDEEPDGSNPMLGRLVKEKEIGALLKGVSGVGGGNVIRADEFRISLAGAQEKTALMRQKGRWYVPHGATPSTHILKLPLELVGGQRLNLNGSVENEWLCSKIMSGFGLETAQCEIQTFDDVKVLIVERFDRMWNAAKTRILRLPQEDFCQVTGTASSSKYEADGGPGIETIMRLLLGSQESIKDRTDFLTAQVLFWLMAAPDGHAKNFSVSIGIGGRFQLTPFYDVLSFSPLLGHGDGKIAPEKLRLAMAVSGKNKHYEWKKINLNHFKETAKKCGAQKQWETVVDRVFGNLPQVVSEISSQLPKDFPGFIAEPILKGMLERGKVRLS